jgi:CRP-like cAMP-binding protein
MANEDKSGAYPDMAARLARALPLLKPDQIAQVSPKLKRMTFAAGEVIIRQGDPPDRFYIVLRGEAEVTHESASGISRVVDNRKPGESFGEIGLLKNQPRTATVTASSAGQVEVLALEREAFLALVKESRATETQVKQDLIQRMITLASYQD